MSREFTIVLHTALKKVGLKQYEDLKSLEEKYKIHWLFRWERHPEYYPSYSEMVNLAIVDSPTEEIIFLNDRTCPKVKEVERILELLDQGYGLATQYSFGFMGLRKELIRKVGWFDNRFLGAGNEDDDYVLRLRLANIAFYESAVADYDYSWKTPVRPPYGDKCSISGPHFYDKWRVSHNEITKVMGEQNCFDDLGPSTGQKFLDWSHSVIGEAFGLREGQGDSRTWHFRNKDGVEFKRVVDKSSL